MQEVKRKERLEKERVAQQNEFLNRSLRGSKKLQALESGRIPSSGVVNDAYTEDETQQHAKPVEDEEEAFLDTLHKAIGKLTVPVG